MRKLSLLRNWEVGTGLGREGGVEGGGPSTAGGGPARAE